MLDKIKNNFLVNKVRQNILEHNINIFAVSFLFILQVIVFLIFSRAKNSSLLSYGLITDLSFIMFLYFIFFYLMKFKAGKITFCVFTVISNLIICADIMYYYYFSDILGILDLWNLRWLEGGYGVNIPWQVIIILVLTALMVSLIIFYKKFTNKLSGTKYFEQFINWGRQDKVAKTAYTIVIAIFSIFLIQASINNTSMLFRPEFETISEYNLSKFYIYDKIGNASKFSEYWGYYYYRVVNFVRWLF